MTRFRMPIGRAPRAGALAACLIAAGACTAAIAAPACAPGSEACPVVLKMAPGATSDSASGSVSGESPDYYFTFAARAGQTLTLHLVGGDIKSGPGIPITFPDGGGGGAYLDTPFALPQTGGYLIYLHANTMSEGPFGKFTLTLTIK